MKEDAKKQRSRHVSGIHVTSLNSHETQRTAIPKDKEKIKVGKVFIWYMLRMTNITTFLL